MKKENSVLQNSKFEFRPFDTIFFPLIIIAASVVPWISITGVPFINDDFQVLIWNYPENFLECFRPFFSADISVAYWRPLVNTFHSLTLWLFGYDPLPFRIFNMFIYAGCCLAFAYFIRKLGIKPVIALITAVFFAVLPSHEISVAWIAGRGDTMAALFILLASIFYIDGERSNKKRYGILATLFFLMAILSKEIAFMWIFFPFLYQITRDKDSRSFKQASIFSLELLAYLLIVILYRYFIIEASLLDSRNLQSVTFGGIFYNLAAYLPLSFVNPEILESMYHSFSDNYLLAVFISVLIILVILFSLKELMKMSAARKRLFLFGLAWFLVFIIPVSTLLMRWYVFTASIGLMISLATLIDLDLKKKTANGMMFIVLLLIIRFSIMDFRIIQNWEIAGDKMNMIIEGFEKVDAAGYNRISLWAVPDKINRVNTMKIGVQEAVNYALGRKNIEVSSHLRVECSDETRIRCRRQSWNSIQLLADKARFLPVGGKSTAYPEADTMEINSEDLIMKMVYPDDKTKKSSAEIIMNRKNDILYLYYNGQNFVPLCD